MRSEEIVGRTHVSREVKDRQVVIKTTTHDDDLNRRNAEARNAELIRSGRDDLRVHPKGAKVSYAFSADPYLWHRAKLRHPELFAELEAPGRRPDGTPIEGVQYRKELAAQRIALLYPHFVVSKPTGKRLVPGSSFLHAA
jgi:hypothetical protein